MFMRQIFCLLSLIILLDGCSNSLKRSIGVLSSAPDEFMVVSNPSLVVPPNFTLRPPRATEISNAPSAHMKATETMMGKSVIAPRPATVTSATTASAGEQLLLQKAGTAKADPAIRQQLDKEHKKTQLPEDASMIDRIKKAPSHINKEKKLLDPAAERARLQKNKSEGKAVTEGETPLKTDTSSSVIGTILGD
jgi:hypothetical protein